VEWATKVAPSLAETKVAAAELKYRMEDDYAGAEQAFAQAIALAPGNALPHLRYAMFLQKQLRFDEAIEQSRVAERLEPASLRARWELAYMLFLAGRCEESLPQVRRALELDANHSKSYRTLGQCLETLGRDEEAMEAYHAAGKIGLSHLGGLYARTGRTVAALRILEALRHPTATPQSGYAPLGIAYVYSGLGEHARAIEHVKEAQARGVQLPIAMRVAPGWAPLRAVVAFRQIEGSIEGAKAAVRSRRAATNERS
jgi:tetratricopeptide (TPR) repeat protein